MSTGITCWGWCRTLSFRARACSIRTAGFDLAHMIRRVGAGCADRVAVEPHGVPARAQAEGVSFLQKAFAHVAADLRRYLTSSSRLEISCSGMPDGTEVARARD